MLENKNKIKLKAKNTTVACIIYVESVMRQVGRNILTWSALIELSKGRRSPTTDKLADSS